MRQDVLDGSVALSGTMLIADARQQPAVRSGNDERRKRRYDRTTNAIMLATILGESDERICRQH